MRSISLIILTAFCFLGNLTAQELPGYDSLVSKLMNDFKTPGVAVAVMENYEFSEYIKGTANAETEEPVTRTTLFNLASISKIMTAHMVMQLVDEKKIDIDHPIEEYLKSWKFEDSLFDSKQITTRMVLNHSGGLSREFGPGFTPEDSLLPLTDILSGKSEKRKSLRIVLEPGSKQLYSNLGYGLLQLLVEDVSGMGFEEYAKKKIFDPLKMKSTSFSDPLKLDSQILLATPHNYKLSPLDQERFVVVAAAGLISNLQDMELFMLDESKNNSINSQASINELHNLDSLEGFGLGHMVKRDEGKATLLGHTGLGMGWNSSFQFVPNTGNGIIILTNGDNGYYIHNTLKCYWYYLLTGKRLRSSIVAPDKKLNRLNLYSEIAYEMGELSKDDFEQFTDQVESCRKILRDEQFTKFVIELKKLRTRMSESIVNPELNQPLNEAFESCFYWMKMPWFNI